MARPPEPRDIRRLEDEIRNLSRLRSAMLVDRKVKPENRDRVTASVDVLVKALQDVIMQFHDDADWVDAPTDDDSAE